MKTVTLITLDGRRFSEKALTYRGALGLLKPKCERFLVKSVLFDMEEVQVTRRSCSWRDKVFASLEKVAEVFDKGH